MKYIDEYRNRDLIASLSEKIKQTSKRRLAIMEVCGGHTMSIQKFGLPSLLPDTIALISGPGCPVCVTDRKYIDKAIAFSGLDNVMVATYGDLIRVPGTYSSLDKEKARGRDIRIVYTTLDALTLAENNPTKTVVFLGIGFETTAPSSAISIQEANRRKIKNYMVFSAHKVMPPAMSALLDDGIAIDGYLGPGHVSTVTGSKIYYPLYEKYNISVVISGFEPADIMHSILMLVEQFETNHPGIAIQYKRAVTFDGNRKAQHIIHEVFEPRDDWWRGLGVLPDSGLGIRPEFQAFDAEKQLTVDVPPSKEPKGCICGSVLKGVKTPHDCSLFKTHCNPSNPIGACMVSSEGTCHAFYKYAVR
jgi:hydrogenase expression/formation protein HypD